MPSKAVKAAPEKKVKATETARPARKAAPRATTARHRAAKAPVTEPVIETSLLNSQEIIAGIAYGYWESRGYRGGDALEDWARAEQEFSARKAASSAA